MKSIFAVALVVALGSTVPVQALAQAKSSPQDVAEGRDLFAAFSCSACHGTRGSNGNGGPLTGVPLLPYAAVLNQVRTPRRQMPAYPSSELSDLQLQKIYAYLGTIPKSPDAKDISILNRP